jgi:hypothetical protein
MLNNDMVENQPESQPWIVTLYKYDNSYDITEKAVEVLRDYTVLTPNVLYTNSSGSDSYSYYQQGYKTTFAIEYDFSPYYHSINDLTEYLNFEYCRQIAKMNFVLLAHYAIINSSSNFIRENRQNENLITIYPVPANDFIIVHNNDNIKIDKVNIFDFSGRMVESLSDSMPPQSVIRLDNYKNGIYFMVFYTDRGTIIKKVIKE